MSRRLPFICVAVAAGMLSVATSVRAQVLVGVVEDLGAERRWLQEQDYLYGMLSGIQEELKKTDELIALLGDPSRANTRLVAPSSSLLQPVDNALALPTREKTLHTAGQRFHLNSVATPTYDKANEVTAQYKAFGETHAREKTRYTHFGLQESLNARHKTAAERAEAVEKHELEVQRKALDALRRVKTHAEAAILQSVLTASEQRVQMAHAKLAQAWSELEVFRGQIGFEQELKAEADREWTETVIARMRQKALSGYRAQIGGSP